MVPYEIDRAGQMQLRIRETHLQQPPSWPSRTENVGPGPGIRLFSNRERCSTPAQRLDKDNLNRRSANSIAYKANLVRAESGKKGKEKVS